MSDGGPRKELTFIFKVDQTSLQNLKSAIKSITEDMNKLIQTSAQISRLGGAGSAPVVGGGGSTSPQGMAQAIRTSSAGPGAGGGGLGGVFTGAASSAQMAARALKLATQSMASDVRQVQAMLSQPLNRGGLFQAMANPGQGGGYPTSFAPGASVSQPPPLPQRSILPNFGNGAYGPPTNNPMGPQVPWGTPWAGNPGQGGSPPGGGGGGPGRSWFPNSGMGWARVGGMAIAGVNAGFDEAMAGGRAFTSAGAARGHLVENRIRQLAGGDYKYLYASRNMDGETGRDVMHEVQGVAQANQYWQGTKQAAGTAASSIPIIGGLFGGSKGPGGIAGGFTSAVQHTNMAEEALKRIAEDGQTKFFTNIAMDRFQGSMQSRYAAQRLGLASGTTAGTGALAGMGHDSYGHLEAKLTHDGYNMGDLLGAKHGLMATGGKAFAGKNAWTAMAASAAGYGGFSELMGMSARTGGGMGLARGAVGGGIDKNAGIAMGMGVVGNGFDVQGTTTGLGLLAAMQGGVRFNNSAGDFNRVNALQAGAGLMAGQIGGKIDSYQTARNAVSAIDILGPGASFYAQDALGNGMNLKQMADIMSGETTASMRAHGISKADVTKQFNSTVSSTFDRFEDSGASDPMSVAIRQFRTSGKELPDYLKSLPSKQRKAAIENLGVFAGQQMNEGAEAGIGYMQIAAGMGSKLQAGSIGVGLTGLEKKHAEAQGKIEAQFASEIGRVFDPLDKTIGASSDAVKKLRYFGENLGDTSERFIRAMTNIIEFVEKRTGTSTILDADQKAGSKTTTGKGRE